MPRTSHYEYIEGMSEEFQERLDSPLKMEAAEIEAWKVRAMIAIAQQLTMIVAALKKQD